MYFFSYVAITVSFYPQASEEVVFELQRRIALLEGHIAEMARAHQRHKEFQRLAHEADPSATHHKSYYMTVDDSSSDQWETFGHVYQVHEPKIILSNTIRDVSGRKLVFR